MRHTKLKPHHIKALRRRYPGQRTVWSLIVCAVLEIVAMQLDDEAS